MSLIVSIIYEGVNVIKDDTKIILYANKGIDFEVNKGE
jgi:hypothetical protein